MNPYFCHQCQQIIEPDHSHLTEELSCPLCGGQFIEEIENHASIESNNFPQPQEPLQDVLTPNSSSVPSTQGDLHQAPQGASQTDQNTPATNILSSFRGPIHFSFSFDPTNFSSSTGMNSSTARNMRSPSENTESSSVAGSAQPTNSSSPINTFTPDFRPTYIYPGQPTFSQTNSLSPGGNQNINPVSNDLASNLSWVMPMVRQILNMPLFQNILRRSDSDHPSSLNESVSSNSNVIANDSSLNSNRTRPRSSSSSNSLEGEERGAASPRAELDHESRETTSDNTNTSSSTNIPHTGANDHLRFTFLSNLQPPPSINQSPNRNVSDDSNAHASPSTAPLNEPESQYAVGSGTQLHHHGFAFVGDNRSVWDNLMTLFQQFMQTSNRSSSPGDNIPFTFVVNSANIPTTGEEGTSTETDTNSLVQQVLGTIFQLPLQLGEGGIVGDYALGQTAFDNIISQLLDQDIMRRAPPPAPEESLSSLKRIRLTKDLLSSIRSNSDSTEKKYHHDCSICKEDFKTDDLIIEIPCRHWFHEECVIPWLRRNGTCPICRYSLVKRTNPENSS